MFNTNVQYNILENNAEHNHCFDNDSSEKIPILDLKILSPIRYFSPTTHENYH